MTKKKVKVCVKAKRRPRRSSGEQFAEKIRSLLDLVEAQYESETPQAAYYSAVTVVAGAFVWAMKRGCPPLQLKAVMGEALEFALRTEGVPMSVMVEREEWPVDPKEVN